MVRGRLKRGPFLPSAQAREGDGEEGGGPWDRSGLKSFWAPAGRRGEVAVFQSHRGCSKKAAG